MIDTVYFLPVCVYTKISLCTFLHFGRAGPIPCHKLVPFGNTSSSEHIIICDNVYLALLMEHHTILFNLLHLFKPKMKQDITDIDWINRKKEYCQKYFLLLSERPRLVVTAAFQPTCI